LRGRGVERHQFCVQGGRTLALQSAPDFSTNVGRDRGHGSEARRQGLEIKAGAADENRDAALTGSAVESFFGVAAPAPDGIVLGCIHVPVKTMHDPRLLFGCRARGDDAQIAIHLH
jgi:hypothetical protein